MREEESNNNDLERRLRAYFRAEDRELEAPPGLWDRLSSRLEEQPRPGWRRRVRAIFRLGQPWSAASLSKALGAPGARKALAVSMVLVVVVGIAYLGVTLATDGVAVQYQASGGAATATPRPLATAPPIATTARALALDSDAEYVRLPAAAMEGVLAIGVVGDALQFNTKRFTASAGSEVVLTFSNTSTINQHNWVLVQTGTKDAVATAGAAAGPANDWIPANDERVLFHTRLLDPGQTAEIRFAAPPPGTYQFVCTFPGHNFTMFGEFEVTP